MTRRLTFKEFLKTPHMKRVTKECNKSLVKHIKKAMSIIDRYRVFKDREPLLEKLSSDFQDELDDIMGKGDSD